MSPQYTQKDYLDLKTKSSDQQLEESIKIFHDRIQGWYFDAIDTSIGFANRLDGETSW